MTEHMKTIAIVDDHPIVIEGLRSLLAANGTFKEIHSFTTGAGLLQYLEYKTIDIVLLDIALPDINGLDLCRKLKTSFPDLIVLGLSNQAERSTILNMLDSGATGYLLKSTPAEELIGFIQKGLEGRMVFSREIEQIINNSNSSDKQLPALTRREKDILHLLAEGKTTLVIAGELHLSPYTIDTYRKNLLQKFDVKNTTELLILLVREGRL